MRRKLGWQGECEREGGEENLRLDGVFPALPFASATPARDSHCSKRFESLVSVENFAIMHRRSILEIGGKLWQYPRKGKPGRR